MKKSYNTSRNKGFYDHRFDSMMAIKGDKDHPLQVQVRDGGIDQRMYHLYHYSDPQISGLEGQPKRIAKSLPELQQEFASRRGVNHARLQHEFFGTQGRNTTSLKYEGYADHFPTLTMGSGWFREAYYSNAASRLNSEPTIFVNNMRMYGRV